MLIIFLLTFHFNSKWNIRWLGRQQFIFTTQRNAIVEWICHMVNVATRFVSLTNERCWVGSKYIFKTSSCKYNGYFIALDIFINIMGLIAFCVDDSVNLFLLIRANISHCCNRGWKVGGAVAIQTHCIHRGLPTAKGLKNKCNAMYAVNAKSVNTYTSFFFYYKYIQICLWMRETCIYFKWRVIAVILG